MSRDIFNWINLGGSVVILIETGQKLQRIDGTHPVDFSPRKLANSTPENDSDAENIYQESTEWLTSRYQGIIPINYPQR